MKHMLTTLLAIALFLLIASTVFATPPPIKIELSEGGRLIYLTSAKDAEVVHLDIDGPTPYEHWGVFLDHPALPAGIRATVLATYPARQVSVLSVAWSDRTTWGDPSAAAVLVARNQIRDGLAVDALSPQEWNAPVAYLLRLYKKAYPERPAPEVRFPNPNGGVPATNPDWPWFTQGSMTLVVNMNGLTEPNSWDAGGNPEASVGCAIACAGFVNAAARCPSGSGRTTLDAYGSGYIQGCEDGYMTIFGSAMYGYGGLGGSFSQRFGVTAYGEFLINGASANGQVVDSCGYPKPLSSGTWALPCHNQ